MAETTKPAKIVNSLNYEFGDDGLVSLMIDTSDDSLFNKQKTTVTYNAEVKFTKDDDVKDHKGRHVKAMRVAYVLSDSEYLKLQRERAVAKAWREWAVAFKHVEVSVMEEFVNGQCRLKNGKGKTKAGKDCLSLVRVDADSGEGVSYDELPTVLDSPENERVDEKGVPIMLTREKVNDAVTKAQGKITISIPQLEKNIKLAAEMRDKEKKGTPSWELYDNFVAMGQAELHKAKTREAIRAQKTPSAKGATVVPTSDIVANRKALGITDAAAAVA